MSRRLLPAPWVGPAVFAAVALAAGVGALMPRRGPSAEAPLSTELRALFFPLGPGQRLGEWTIRRLGGPDRGALTVEVMVPAGRAILLVHRRAEGGPPPLATDGELAIYERREGGSGATAVSLIEAAQALAAHLAAAERAGHPATGIVPFRVNAEAGP